MNRYSVHIDAHHIGRHDVPAADVRAPGETAELGILQALRWHHSDNGLPGLRSYLKASFRFCHAEVIVDPKDEALRRQRERDARRAG